MDGNKQKKERKKKEKKVFIKNLGYASQEQRIWLMMLLETSNIEKTFSGYKRMAHSRMHIFV